MTQFYSMRSVQKAVMNNRAFQFSHPEDTRWSREDGSVAQQCKLDNLRLISRTHIKVRGEKWVHRELPASILGLWHMSTHTRRKKKNYIVFCKEQKARTSWNKWLARWKELLGKAEENSSKELAPCTRQSVLHKDHRHSPARNQWWANGLSGSSERSHCSRKTSRRKHAVNTH